MKRWVSATFLVVLVLLAGAAAATAWYVFALDLESFRAPIEKELTKLLDRPVELGRIRKGTGLLRPHIEVDELVVLDDPATRSELARIGQARIGLDLLPLLRGTLRIDAIRLRSVRVSVGTNAAGDPLWPLRLSTHSSGGGRSLHVELEQVDLHQGNLVYHDGEQGHTTKAVIDALELGIHAGGRFDLSLDGELEGRSFRLEGRIAPPSVASPEARQQIVVEGQLGQLSLRASGGVEDVLGLAGLDLALEAHAPRLPLPDDWGELLSLEPVQASARLTDDQGIARLEDVTIQVGEGPKRLQLTGHVDDLFGERRASLDATLDLPSLRTLSPLVEIDLPDLGPVRGTMRLLEAGDRVHIEGLELTAGGDTDPRVRVAGTISDLMGLVELDLRADAAAPDLSGLAAGIDPRLRELGPLRIETHVVGAGSSVRLSELEIELGTEDDLWAKATGEVDIVAGAHHVDLELRAGASKTRRLATLLGRELPELGPVTATAALRGGLKQLGVESGELRVGRPGQTLLVLRGKGLPLSTADPIDLDAELSARDLRSLGQLFGSELVATGPVRASGRLRVAPGHLALHHLEARIGSTGLTGSMASLVDSDGRRHVTASLASREVRLADLLPMPDSDGTDAGPSFRERRLPVGLLRAQDAELVLRVDHVVGRRALDLADLKLRLVLEGGRLSVEPLSFRLRKGAREGRVEAVAGVDTNGSEPSWWLRADATNIDVANLAAQFTAANPVTGMALLRAHLTSHGESGQQVLEGLDGDLAVAMRGAELHGDYVLLLRRDLITALALKSVRADTTEARCLLGRFDVESGVVATQTLLLDSAEVLLHGKGKVDLGRERFDLVLTPQAKRPGIGLMEPVALRGSFQKPEMRPVTMALAKDAAKALLGTLVLPGVGTLAPFLHVGTLGRDPCEKALASYLESEQAR